MACYEEYHTDPGHNGCGSMEEHFGQNWKYETERERRYQSVNEAWRRFMAEVLTPWNESGKVVPLSVIHRAERYISWFKRNKAWR